MGSDFDQSLRYEEQFHSTQDRKFFKKERKEASLKDRSKYKKSDQKNQEKPSYKPPSDQEKEGKVLAIYPEAILVDSEGVLYQCQLKGSLKKEKHKAKNLVAVGDLVLFEQREPTTGLIVAVQPRYSVLSRADNLLRHKEQLIAVNIDQVIITTSVHSPSLKPSLIDRYIIACQKGNLSPVIVINKIDLLDLVEDEEKKLALCCQHEYQKLGIPCLFISIKTGEGLHELKELMHKKTSVFSGQSGVGKSSLINAVLGAALKTGDIVHKTLKGSHTTTTTHLIPLEGGGFCVDTPGIKSFGVWDLEEKEIQDYFSEIAQMAKLCKFTTCSHTNEPCCAVLLALEQGEISTMRFASYLSLLETAGKKHQHR